MLQNPAPTGKSEYTRTAGLNMQHNTKRCHGLRPEATQLGRARPAGSTTKQRGQRTRRSYNKTTRTITPHSD
eukprot:9698974-Lingulodinium_polyedra.AAC.1